MQAGIPESCPSDFKHAKVKRHFAPGRPPDVLVGVRMMMIDLHDCGVCLGVCIMAHEQIQ